MPTIAEALEIAVREHNASNLNGAEQIYRQILAVDAQHAHAWHLWGVIALQTGHYHWAIERIERAISFDATSATFYNNLGESYRASKLYDQALTAYARAIQLDPKFAAAYSNAGNVWKKLNNLGEAMQAYRMALQIDPQIPEANNNLGLLFLEQGDLVQAETLFRTAIQAKPNYAQAHLHLGMVLKAQGDIPSAASCYRQAMRHNPHLPEPYFNLGNILHEQEKWSDAAKCYQEALLHRPQYAEALNNLGIVNYESGNWIAAQSFFEQALVAKPDFLAALGAKIHLSQHMCIWSHLEAETQQLLSLFAAQVASHAPLTPFSLITLSKETTATDQLLCAQQFATKHLSIATARGRAFPCHSSLSRKSKLRVGYLSADLHEHATAWLITALFEKHDRSKFEIHAYSYGPPKQDHMRQRIEQGVDKFIDLHTMSHVQAANTIAKNNVAILVDLKGYTTGARTEILALRPAPIQVNYLGFPGTMGAEFIDYILVDKYIVPSAQQPFYTEKLVHLPGCYQVNDSQRKMAAVAPTRSACGLPENGFVFCSFNNNYKITPDMFAVWMQLLQEIPQSVLWLLDGNAYAPHNLRKAASQYGIEGHRLCFAPHVSQEEHLARHCHADLFLDTFPVNAHTSASDALWSGCPVVTLSGETFISRVAGSLLTTLGLPELIAKNRDDYTQIALNLAKNGHQLQALRDRLALAREKSSLFNTEQFARHIEFAYERMFERYLQKLAPAPLEIQGE